MATVVGIGGKRADILRVHYEGFNENFDESVDLSKTPGRVASYGTYAYLSKGEKRGNAGDSEEGGAGGGDQSASAKRAKLSGKLEEVEKTLETALAKARDTGVEGHVEADVRRAQAALAAAKAGGAGETGGGKDAGKGAGARRGTTGTRAAGRTETGTGHMPRRGTSCRRSGRRAIGSWRRSRLSARSRLCATSSTTRRRASRPPTAGAKGGSSWWRYCRSGRTRRSGISSGRARSAPPRGGAAARP